MEKPIQVFCCYAHEDHSFLVALKKHLSPSEGLITVQADIDVSPGKDREQEISRYLDTAQVILLLISPDFMKSNYKEMERALERGEKGEARVIPVILSPVDWQKAPFAGLQYLPRNAKPVTTWSNRGEAFSEIAKEIRSVCEELLTSSSPPPLLKIGIDKVKDGKIVRVENIIFPDSSRHILTENLGDLQPTFDTLITDWTQDFVGRKSIFNQLDKFLMTQTSGYFIIEGDPGIGKTALIAQLVKERGYLHHFNMQGIREISLFLESICKQLTSLFQLDYVPVPKEPYTNNTLFNSLLKEASGKLKADERLVLAIDALDEADRPPPDQNELYLPSALPRGIFIVVTSRHKYSTLLLVSRPGEPKPRLTHDSPDNKEDVRAYIKFYIDKYNIQQQIQSFNMPLGDFIETMLTKSEGNFMYLHYVLPAIKDGGFLLGTLKDLPQGLKAYYQFHWEKMRIQDTETFNKLYKPVICVLVAMEEDVSIDEIAEVAGIEYSQALQIVRQWREFLHVKKTNGIPFYRIYHSTFQEFLEDEVDPGLRTYHRMIASTYSRLKNKYAGENG